MKQLSKKKATILGFVLVVMGFISFTYISVLCFIHLLNTEMQSSLQHSPYWFVPTIVASVALAQYFGRLTYFTAATSVFIVAVLIPQSVLYYASFRLSLGSFGTMENLTPWYVFVVPPALAVITLWVCRLIAEKFNGQVS